MHSAGVPDGPEGAPVAVRTPDPGSRPAARAAWLIGIPLLLLVIALQQTSIYVGPSLVPEPEQPVVAPGADDQGLLVARLFLKIAEAWPALRSGGEPMNSLDQLWKGDQATPTTAREREWRTVVEARIAEFRAALVAADVARPRDAVARLDALDSRLAEDAGAIERFAEGVEAGTPAEEALDRAGEVVPVLRSDVELARRHFVALARESERAATAGEAAGETAGGAQPMATAEPALDAESWDGLEERHGWFAKLARVAGLPADHPERAALLAGGEALLVLIVAICAVIGTAALGAIAAAIWLIAMMAMRRLPFWFVPPAPGGSVYLEAAAAFVVAFLGTQILAFGLAQIPGLADYMVGIAMGIQWLVLLVVLWPLARGVSVRQWRRDLGLIAPRGVMREIGAGFIGYLAGLPLLLAAGLVGIVLKQIQDRLLEDHIPYSTGGNPVLEMVAGGGVWQLVLFVTLATIWAPLVEEVVFRGCLFRHLRGRLAFLLAAPISALAFGLMHQYEIVLLGPVLALGVTFAFIREWRGSLVGAIVMHALHNGTVLVFVISLVRLSG